MGIYIKGMEMPKSGIVIAIVASNGAAKLSEELINFPTGGSVNMVKQVEAIELPPHGRLIDGDAFSTKIIEIIERQKYDDFYAKSISVGEILREVVSELRGESLCGFNNAPTIIEAEGKTNK